MDIVSYALSKKIAEHAVSGVQSMSVEGQNLIINTKDSGVLTMTFPTPKDGVSVADIDVNANNQIVFTMSDGTEFISGKIPTVKGDAGFSPTITENADNTDKIYKLDITTADSTFTTPNLKGGAGGSGEENKIDSISVNGVNIVPDENKNVDITVPTVTNDLTDELKSSYDDAVTEKHTHDNKTVLDNITAEKVESWDKAEENVQSDWNETDDTADGFIKNKPTIPDAYDDTALSGRVDNVETSIGDMSTIEVKSVSDLVSAINVLYNAFMSSINYADKKLTIIYRNGGTVDIDMSAIITDTNIGELSNIDDTGITDKQVLSYDTATNKYIPTTIDTAGVLADAKKYTDDEIAKINNADAISVDEKPTYSNGTITYKKDGVEKTITGGDFWFFYTVDDMAYQTIWIDGVEFTTSVDGSVDFKDFVSKTNDLTSTYTGEETDKTKVTTIASLDALYAIISTALGKKVNTADIVDNLSSDATDKPLSAAQGKALDTKISNFVTTVEEDYAKTTDIPTTLPANGGNADTVNNHTVESDVPTDAVFTDTIYDDTEVKENIAELNSNLSALETNLVDLKKEEVDKKIESEVATDFSQADTPQFQQTIDDVQNEVSELKGDLFDLKNIYNGELFYDTASIELAVSSQRIKSDCITEYDATGYSRSGSQEVSVGDTFVFYGKGNTDTAIICGYDAELSPVSCIAYSGDSAEYKLITITNENWKRVSFCSSTVGITPVIVKVKKSLDSIRVGSFQNLLESEKGYELGYYDGTGYVLDSLWWCHKRYDVSAYVGRNYILKYVNGSWVSPRTYFEDAEGNKTILGLDYGSMRHDHIVTGTIPIDAKYLYHTVNTDVWDTHEFLIETNSNAYVDVASKNFVKDSIKDYTLTKRKPCCCFIFDDGNSTDETIKAIFDSRRLKCGFAPASTIADRYLQYSKEGFSILAHGDSLPSPLSESAVSNYLHQRKMVVNMAGIECYGWVTPSSVLDDQYQSLVYDHFKYGFTIYKGEDLSNVYIPKTQKSYSLWRSNIDTKTVAQIQAIIDEAITNNAMVVFYSHGEITSENLASVIDYCIGEQIKVLAPDECIEYFFAHRHNEDD